MHGHRLSPACPGRPGRRKKYNKKENGIKKGTTANDFVAVTTATVSK